MPPSPQPSATTRDGRSSPTVSVVIQARNESAALPHVLRALPPVDEVIVVDGGSVDDTVAAARAALPGTHVVRQTRSGEGNALACGFAASRGDIVVTLNADGTNDPGEIPRFVDALTAGADVAHGSRFRPGGGDLAGGPLERVAAALLSRVVNVFLGTRCTDPTWGYNAYRRDALPVLDLPGVDVPGLERGRCAWGDGPEIAPLIIIRAAVEGLRVVEVAGVGHPRMHGDERRDLFRRVLLTLRALVTEFLRRRRFRGAAAPRARRSAPARSAGAATVAVSRRSAPASPTTAAGSSAVDAPVPPAKFPISVARYSTSDPGPWAGATARAGGRHAAVTAVPPPRRDPLTSGLPPEPASQAGSARQSGPPMPAAHAGRADPVSPASAPGSRVSPSDEPPVPVESPAPSDVPAATSGFPPAAAPTGRDAVRGSAGRRRAYPGPRPAWAAHEPGTHRTIDIGRYDIDAPHGGVDDTGVHHLPDGDPGDRGAAGRRSGLYDTGVHRVGVYQSGVHRTDVYDKGAHHLPTEDGPMYRRSAPRDVGGGRRRLDARDRHSDGSADLTVVPGDGRDEDRSWGRDLDQDRDGRRSSRRSRSSHQSGNGRQSPDEGWHRHHGSDPGREPHQSSDEGWNGRQSPDEGRHRHHSSDPGRDRHRSSHRSWDRHQNRDRGRDRHPEGPDFERPGGESGPRAGRPSHLRAVPGERFPR